MTFVKKHTVGGTAGFSWQAGEVQNVPSLLADELVALAPEDFEIVADAGEPAPKKAKSASKKAGADTPEPDSAE